VLLIIGGVASGYRAKALGTYAQSPILMFHIDVPLRVRNLLTPVRSAKQAITAIKTFENYLTFFLDYLHLIHRDVLYRLRGSHLRMLARGGTADYFEIFLVMSGQEYRLDLLPALAKPVILDLGAHIGSFSLYSLIFFEDQTPTVYAVEPATDNLKYLTLNFMLNGLSGQEIQTAQLAIGGWDGFASLDNRGPNDSHSITGKEVSPSQESCPIRTLARFAVEAKIMDVDIVKMDIEGSEYSVLGHQPSYDFLKRRVKFIFMEVHPLDSRKNMKWIKEKMATDFSIIFERDQLIYFKNRNREIGGLENG
jgi:FkbM family methyltransferase